MSRKPISEREQTAAIEFLERCGWTNAELIWEQIQEAAAQAWLSGDADDALELWEGALEVAEEHLGADDPRRVASRLNASAVSGEEGWDAELVVEAAEAWRDCETWVSNLKPSVPARSSMFHLRLRTKHPGAYDQQRHEMLQDLHREGLGRLQGASGGESFPQRLDRWHAEKPREYNDHRKLLAAVLLMRYPD